jgi:hypothetical protein
MEFLEEQRERLKPATYRGYDYAIDLFEAYLDGYAYQYLDEKNAKRHERLCVEKDMEFSDIFGPQIIDTSMISEFLGDFMVRKVMCGKGSMRTVGTVMRQLMEWLHGKGYMGDEKREDAMETVDALKDDLPKVAELADLISDYAENALVGEHTRTVDGYFTVTRVEPGKLWFRDYLGGGREMGPVPVSKKISSLCEAGWTVSLQLGKTGEGWRILQSGCVYPL